MGMKLNGRDIKKNKSNPRKRTWKGRREKEGKIGSRQRIFTLPSLSTQKKCDQCVLLMSCKNLTVYMGSFYFSKCFCKNVFWTFDLLEIFWLILCNKCMYISATAALYFKMYSFGMTLVIICYYKLFGLLSKWLSSLMRNYFPKRPSGAPLPYFVKIIWCSRWFCNPPPLFWGSVLLYLRSPTDGCCSISDDLSCSCIYDCICKFYKPGRNTRFIFS